MIEEVGIGLVIEAAWKSLLVAGFALLVLALLKSRSAAERACVAHFGMAAVLLVPVLALAGPKLEVSFLAGEPAAASGFVAASASGSTGNVWLILYLVPTAALLGLTLAAIFRLFALRARANVIVQQGWLTALAHAQRRMGIKHGTALLATNELSSPISWGVLRPVIVLNEQALETSADAEAIIAHELAHVARFDWLNLLIARIATALFWFNPLVWLLARQGHQLREEAADDAVLRADVCNTDYAALLVGAARHEGKGLLLAANGVTTGKGSLAQRVRRILEPTLRRGPARLAWSSGCAAAVVLIAGPVGALAPLEPEAPAAAIEIAAVAPMRAPTAAPAPTVPAAAPTAAPARAPASASRLALARAPAAAPAAIAAPVAPAAAAPAPRGAPAAPAAPGSPGVAPVPPTPPAPAHSGIAVARASATALISPDALLGLRAHGIDASSKEEYAASYPRLRKASAAALVEERIMGRRHRQRR